MDKLSPAGRSENMAAISSKNTGPELAVRRYLHAAGLRYRLHGRGLPGRPDIVFPSRRVCIFVHGCFWHGCSRCIDGLRKVKSNTAYWNEKIEGNRRRDERHCEALKEGGWTVLQIWDCQSRDPAILQSLTSAVKAIQPRRG
jgi:DNA mismatch endonuclease (patch repair protein)